jgi:hypothetical protein
MRNLSLPVALLAAAALIPSITGTGFAAGAPVERAPLRAEKPKRAAAHLALHVSRHHVMAGSRLVVSGRVLPAGKRRVKVLVDGPSGGQIKTTTERDGSFSTTWGLPATGIHSVRAYGVHDREVSGSASATRRFTVYRQAHASYYGPGFYGGHLACGGTLQPGTLGVAHKYLPCGSRVRLRYQGNTVTVPVVDRGPYVGGRDYDLTEATKAKLGFPDLGVVLASR